MNKSILHVAPEDKEVFQSICNRQRMAFNLILETEKNVLYEIEWSNHLDLYWLGVWFGYELGLNVYKKPYYEAHTH
jgi:hypothetical protein